MASLFFLRSALRPHWLITVLLLGLTACESEPSAARRRSAATTTAPGPDSSGVEMEANGDFFEGTVGVEVALNRAGFGDPRGRRGDQARAEPAGDRALSGAGGETSGSGRRRGKRGGAPNEATAASSHDASDGRTANIRVSNEPPVRFHLRLTNRTAAATQLEVADFNSDLGNFVVEPAKITVPPGQSVEADPMISNLGVSSDHIPLTIRIRRNGVTDMHVLSLHVVPPAVPDAESATSPGQTPLVPVVPAKST